MTKFIALEKLNSLLANVKADKAVANYVKNNSNVSSADNVEKRMSLKKIVLRVDAFKTNSGIPFYAFVKHFGKMSVLVDVVTGSCRIFNSCVLASETNVSGKFSINGVTYDVKDTINGHKRYRPVLCTSQKPRQKMHSYNLQESEDCSVTEIDF